MIHVCFGLHDKTGCYSKFTGTAITSIFDNTKSPVTAHILHDNTLTQDNRDKFIYIAVHYGQHVKFYNVEELCADKFNKMIELVPAIKTAWSTIGTFFKLLIPKVIPADINKCIYLDSDMAVNLDIKELWRTELADKPLAAVREMDANAYNYENFDAAQKYLLNAGIVNYEDYFNAGAFVMNLEYLRNAEALIMSGVKWRGEHPQCNCFDQDIWNYLFSKNYLRLPTKFDRFICNERSQGISQTQSAIYHCSSPSLGLDTSDPFNKLWLKYFMKTPWLDAEALGRLFAEFQQTYYQLYVEAKNSLLNLSTIIKGKSRGFFVPSVDLDAIKKIFSISDDEEIILADGKDALPNLVYAMGKAQGKKIFFIMVPNFQVISDTLKQIDFAQGKDFLNGLNFLPTEDVAQLSSYYFIKAM